MKKSDITILSWNVNGIRAVIKKGDFQKFVQKYKPDILCLQETKAERGQAVIDLPQYEEYWNSSSLKKGYSGTAIFTKIKPLSIQLDILAGNSLEKKLHDEQGRDAGLEGRVVSLEFENYFVVTVYTPNSKDDLSRLKFRHKQWDPLFLEHVKRLEKKKPVIFCGDLNVAHEEIDLARPKENKGNCGFTEEEREGLSSYIASGFIDTFRLLHKDEKDKYTWWNMRTGARERNVGWRIDYIFVSKILKTKIEDAFILDDVYGSDHCPVGITLKV